LTNRGQGFGGKGPLCWLAQSAYYSRRYHSVWSTIHTEKSRIRSL